MSIDRHNYEEYFILYMDNELNSEECRMVEAFVQQHPDLKEELDLLQQFKLTPDSSISFLHKEDLLKENGEALITLNNYEEWLVLYIDNELSQPQRIKVESFTTAHPSVAAELVLLQKTKLQPEKAVFTDKQLLYRREEKVRPIGFKWWRAAAAVLILGLGVITALVINNNNNGKDGGSAAINNPVKTSDTNSELVKDTPPAKNDDVKRETLPVVKEEILSPEKNITRPPVYKQAVANNNKTPLKENKKEVKQLLQAPDENKHMPVVADINNKPNNNLPKPDQNPYVNENKKENAGIAQNNTPKQNNNLLTSQNVTNQSPSPSGIMNASLASNPNEEEVIQTDGKKNKNRGFFRKIARTFEKRTNIDPTEDGDKLLVAGFAINMK